MTLEQLVQTTGGEGGDSPSTDGTTGAVNNFIKAASSALPILLSIISGRSASGQQKTSATACADQAERDMEKNRDIYLGDSNRTKADQQMAIQIFDKLANELIQCCGQSSLGTPGQNCIRERLARDNADNWIGGTRYDWPGWYLNPILADKPPGAPTGITAIDKITSDVAKAIGVTPWIALIAMIVLFYILYRRSQA